MLNRLLKSIISLVDFFIPKKAAFRIFYITPKIRWDANMQCVYAFVSKRPDVRCFICYYDEKDIPADYRDKCISFRSVSGFLTCLRAGVIFFDHALPPGMTNCRRKCINLWHGVPIKQIRYFREDDFPAGYLEQQSRNTSMLISSSRMDRVALSASFQIPPQRIVVTGLPRNDLLLAPEPFLAVLPHLQREADELKRLKGNRILILYAPTFRGDSHHKEDALSISSEEEILLARVLKKFNAVLGVRAHLFAAQPQFPALSSAGLVVNLASDIFTNTNLLLNQVDLLVTDYSSIWVDFLLLNRPVLGLCPDRDEYGRERGFLYEFENIFPGKICETVHQLAVELEKKFAEGMVVSYNHVRLTRMFHAYGDGRNTGRVLAEVDRLTVEE